MIYLWIISAVLAYALISFITSTLYYYRNEAELNDDGFGIIVGIFWIFIIPTNLICDILNTPKWVVKKLLARKERKKLSIERAKKACKEKKMNRAIKRLTCRNKEFKNEIWSE
jgi:hypothetical protein